MIADDWRGLRAFKDSVKQFVLARDGWRCVYCGYECPRGCRHYNGPVGPDKKTKRRCLLTIDHRIPRAARPKYWDINNIVTACDACNQAKGAQHVEKFIRSRARLSGAGAGGKARPAAVPAAAAQVGVPGEGRGGGVPARKGRRRGGVARGVVQAG